MLHILRARIRPSARLPPRLAPKGRTITTSIGRNDRLSGDEPRKLYRVALPTILMTLGDGGENSRCVGEMDEEVIEKDLKFADTLGGTNPKNYQLWYHRRALLEICFRNADQEGRVEAA
ncbi:LOW QUALITY PROTEIN: hypothetical protein ACHAWX_004804 [Stephanocyclus meneghinianus]